jgi:hypothetical protein
VTDEEYQEAFDLLRRCVEDQGAEIEDSARDVIDGFGRDAVVSWDTNEIKEEQKAIEEAVDDCQERYWLTLDADYRESRVPQMDPALREAVAKCAESKDFEMTGSEVSLQDLIGEVGVVDGEDTPRAAAVVDCVHTEADRLYPDGWGGNIAFD